MKGECWAEGWKGGLEKWVARLWLTIAINKLLTEVQTSVATVIEVLNKSMNVCW